MRSARALAASRAEELGRPDLADDAALVVSELVSNAILHGGGCRGIHVRRAEGAIRIEVADGTRNPPVMGLPNESSLTGRGMSLIAALSARWGVVAQGTGKTVWAELSGEATGPSSGPSAEELLATWGDDDADIDQRYRLELGDVPTDLLLDAKSHVDNVVRELALASSGAHAGTTAAVPGHLAELLGAVHRFADARLAIKHQALEAAKAGALRTKLVLSLPLSAADAAEDYLRALDDIDAYCRARRLLTLETPPQHRTFRQWYVQSLVAQLRALGVGERPPAAETFERRLLNELDRVAMAKQASERAARLYAVAAALANAATPEAVAEAVLNEGAAALSAAGGGILLATEADTLAVPGVVGYDEVTVAKLRNESPDAELPAAYALRTGESVWLESREERDTRFPELAGLEARTLSLCAVPLTVQNRRLGALRFSFNDPRLFGDDERRFVFALAAQTAQALARAQLQQARVDASRRLQRNLLPPRLPTIPGLDVAAMYQPFGDGMEVGGDFYDVWAAMPEVWAIALGDAAGKGPEAAAMSALVRHTLRALTLTDPDPERAIRLLNQALLDSTPDGDTERFCTAILGVVTLADGIRVQLATGGHPNPLVRRASGATEEIGLRGTLLGTFPDPTVDTAEVVLEPGDAMLFVTDGVLEARSTDGLFGPEGVRACVEAAPTSAAALLRALDLAVQQHTGGALGDDMAAIAMIAG